MDTEKIKADIAANRLEQAEKELLACLEAGSDKAKGEKESRAECLYLLGRIAWKRGDKGAAISRYEQAVAIDPESDAAVALEQARQIMNFYHKDLYNP